MSFDKQKWVINALRRISYRWPPRWAAKVAARIERGKYRCAMCDQPVRDKDVEMDHVQPVVDPLTGYVNLDVYVDRLLPQEEGWQCLCQDCHYKKSGKENKVRRKTKKKKLDKEEDKE
jgi:hypothetical protein